MALSKIAPVLLRRLLNNSPYHPVELVYESHANWPFSNSESHNRSLRISVLDASFNPPTLAHLALANTCLPSEWVEGDITGIDYDAKLLLLSVKNADKVLKSGDASYLQRLEMMSLLAQKLTSTNVAVAITNEPTFVRKSEVLSAFLKKKIASSSTQSPPAIKLTFLVGQDTLERLFLPHYYPSESDMTASLQQFLSPDGDNSSLVSCKRTFVSATSQSTAESQKASALMRHYLDSDRIAIMDIGEELSTYSSSAVRGAIAQAGFRSSHETNPLWQHYITTEIAKYIVEEQLYAVL